MNHYQETDDGEAFVTVTEGTATITITPFGAYGKAKARDFKRGIVRAIAGC